MALLWFYFVTAMLYSLTVHGQNDVTLNYTKPSLVSLEPDPTVTTAQVPVTATTTTENITIVTTRTTTTKPASTPDLPKPTPTSSLISGHVPAAKQGIWSFTDSNDVTCIVVQFAAQLNVTSTKPANSSLTNLLINMPRSAAVVDGSCNGTEQWMKLSWPVKDEAVNVTYNNMVLSYHKKDTKVYSLKYLNITLAPEMFPDSLNTKAPVAFWHGKEWEMSLGVSYSCTEPTQLNMSSDMYAATLTLSHLQEEAFRTAADETFSYAYDCNRTAAILTSIGLGVAFVCIGCILNILVSCCLARRRAAADGYRSITSSTSSASSD